MTNNDLTSLANSIQAVASPFRSYVYGLALEDNGREYVNSKVSVEPTGEAFNSIVLDEATNRPYNPMVNAGAIATTDLIKGNGATERLKRILDMFRRYTGRELDVNVPVFLSEKATGNRNKAIAYLMLNFGMVTDRIEETLDLYFQQCSIMVNGRDLAMMAATLANCGVNPVTGERAIDEHYVQDVISVMLTCGMYDYSGEWTYKVGIPAKSGVGGGITAVVPGKLGIGTFSPLLDAKGNSVRGIKVCQALSDEGGPKNNFEWEALNQLRQNSDRPFYRLEEDNGSPVLRYAEADVLQPSCVSCHNTYTYPGTPKNDWKIGDV